uniref:Uncharacterized protein n=1 Tax=uncultured Alphaproteobacteria bacterium TaxID=91750 RepID=A0A1B0Z2Y1_9PROT|nr:hypothetical protein [uncultured Alphaproteobacteria bacterium]ANO58410.1 hypothetical protein [uncultured Alphaproteobacteria bacterium]
MAKKKSKPLVGNNTIGLGYRLSSHEKLCAERMKQLLKSIDELKKNVASLNDSMSKGKGAVAVLMALGAFVIGVLGYLNIK